MFIHYSFDVPSKNVYFNQQLALKSSMITFIVLTPSPPDANIALVVLKDDHEMVRKSGSVYYSLCK